MESGHAIRHLLANSLRVIHIALWLTLPTVFWLWICLADTPAECVPEYGWYQGNVLCVWEDSHLWITFGLFLLGFLSIASWIYGYSFDIVSRGVHGDKRLPQLRMMAAVEGCGLWCFSLKYWLPAIGFLIAITVYAGSLPLAIGSRAYVALLIMAAPVWLAFVWGQVVGLARYAATGDHTLLYQRCENMRLALTHLRTTLAHTILAVLLTVLCAAAWTGLSVFLSAWRELDFMVEAALGSFGFYMAVLCYAVACSRLVASYALRIGIGDQLKPDARFDAGRSNIR